MSEVLLIYALGGGWGHLNRSLALARTAKQYRVKLISNSQYLDRVDTKYHEIIAISPEVSFQQTSDRLKAILNQEDFDGLIVDTFPRGLGGELKDLLPNIPKPKILVHRYLNPKYIQRYQLKEFVRQNYDLILIPGEDIASAFADLPQTHQTAPWLIRNSNELADLAKAMKILRLTIEKVKKPLILILAAGYATELAVYGKIARSLDEKGYTVRCLSAKLPPACPPDIWCCHYPALECLWLADLAIGSGGYNTIWECDRLSIPLIALPQKRLYDCQKTRIVEQQRRGKCWMANNESIAVNLTQRLLSSFTEKSSEPPSFKNGTQQAIASIESFISNP